MSPDVLSLRSGRYITQGEFAIGGRPDDVITTILGSCVAVCLWDGVSGIGGMNHILLPSEPGAGQVRARGVGASDMERLRNALLKAGADPSRLRAKAFGGASMVAGLSDIGQRNAEFVRGFLADEGIPCVADSLGGRQARQIRFWPSTGRVQHRFVPMTEMEQEPTTGPAAVANDVELFG